MRALVAAVILAVMAGCGAQSTPAAAASPAAEAANPAPGAPPVAPEGRLPDAVRPTRYALEMAIVPERDEFSGTVTADLEVREPTDVIWMHRRALDIDAAELTVGGETIATELLAGTDQVFGIRTAAPLPAGPAKLRVSFRGRFDDDRTQGLYRQAEPDGTVYAYTKFEPMDARQAFPCFDEPQHKVPWQLSFRVDADHVALANAPVVSTADNGDGTKTVVTAETKPMPSYLVAFVVGPFDLVEAGTVGRTKVPLRFIVPKGRGPETRYAAEVTPEVVTLLEDYFDMAYPYAKLDVAVVPRYWGTMEHPGIVAMGQPLTLIPPDAETEDRKSFYANILIHELAHYWFGDYVTMAWWNDIWLNEAFGTWLDAKITDELEPSWGVYLERRVGMRARAMATDALPSSKAIRDDATDDHDIENSFDNGITYDKGASVLTMFEEWVGRERFRDAMRAYMRRFAWDSATTEGLYAVLGEVLGSEVPKAMDTFVSTGGHPLVSMALRCEAGEAPALELSQERYVPLGVDAPAAQRWSVPVCVRYPAGGSTTRQCMLLTGERATMQLQTDACPAWVIGNDGGHGYYRVAYDEALLEALLARGARHQDVAERIVQLDDLEALAQAGKAPLSAVLDYALRMSRASEPRLVEASIAALDWPQLVPDETRAAYDALLQKTYAPLVRRLGWKRRAKDDAATHDLRRAVLRVVGRAGHQPTLRRARQLAQRYLADRKAVADDMVDLVLELGARAGDAELFDAYLAAAAGATDRRESRRFLRALAAFRDPALIERALAVALDEKWDLRESLDIPALLLYDRDTRDRAWAFWTEHFDELAPRITQTSLIGFFAMVGTFCTPEDIAAAEAFLRPRAADIAGAPPNLAQGLERARQCAAVRAHHRDAVSAFLRTSSRRAAP